MYVREYTYIRLIRPYNVPTAYNRHVFLSQCHLSYHMHCVDERGSYSYLGLHLRVNLVAPMLMLVYDTRIHTYAHMLVSSDLLFMTGRFIFYHNYVCHELKP